MIKNLKYISILAFAFFLFVNIYAQEEAPNPKTKGEKERFFWNEGENKVEFNGWVLQSNFVLPLVRYNFPYRKSDEGSLEYFSSAGGGFGLHFGKITIKSETKIDQSSLSDDWDVNMANVFGVGAGALFSQKNDISGTKTQFVFSPTLYFSILNFQLGGGYELGNRIGTNSRFFMTVTVDIPLSKLANTGSFILTNIKGKDGTEFMLPTIMF